MATIENLENIISWREAKRLNKIIGDLIDEGRFKQNFRLINQIEGSAGSMMNYIAEGFEGLVTKRLFSSYILLKGSSKNFLFKQ